MNPDAVLIREAVLCSVSPSASIQQRQQAYQILEDFKQHLTDKSEVIYELLQADQKAEIRQYAARMLENIIRYQWDTLLLGYKDVLKQTCYNIMSQIKPSDPLFIYESISRCIVEMVKREWPQNWPTFLSEMNDYCTSNRPESTDLVMRILRRLSEEVVELNTVPPQRRKDIQTELTSSLAFILPFLVKTLQDNLINYKNMVGDRALTLRTIKSVLDTLNGYVGWCDHSLLTQSDNHLIKLLFDNVSTEEISILCVECLLIISQRRGSVDSLPPLLVLFKTEFLEALYHATQSAAQNAALSDPNYCIYKRLAQLVISLGHYVSNIWSKESGSLSVVETFDKYLLILLFISRQDSLFITSSCFELWHQLIRQGAKHPAVIQCIPVLAEVCLLKLKKVGSPALSSMEMSSIFSRFDFDSVEDWLDSFYKCKAWITKDIYLMRAVSSQPLFQMINDAMEKQLQLTSQNYAGDVSCDTKSLFYLEWEAVIVFHHALLKDLQQVGDERSLTMLGMLMRTLSTVGDPNLLNLLISAISSLTPVMSGLDVDGFRMVFEFIFMMIQYENKSFPAEDAVELHRHCCAVFVKLASCHPNRLVEYFEKLHAQVTLCKPHLDKRSFRLMLEAQVIISQEMNNYDRQVEYMSIVMSESTSAWTNSELSRALGDSISMARFLGLLSADNPEQFTRNRIQMQDAIRDMVVLPKRLTYPKSADMLVAGGFISPSGEPRHPAMAVYQPVLNNLIQCLSQILQLYNPEVYSRFHSDLLPSKVLDLPEAERVLYLGYQLPEDHRKLYKAKTVTAHLQKHILEVIDSLLQIIANASKNCAEQFFKQVDLIEKIIASISRCVEYVHLHVLKLTLRNAIKPLVSYCTNSIKVELINVMVSEVLKKVSDRLDLQWTFFKERQDIRLQQGEADGSNDLTEDEVISDEILRVTCREMALLFRSIIIDPSTAATFGTNTNKASDENENQEMESSDDPQAAHAGSSAHSAEAQLNYFIPSLRQDTILIMLSVACKALCWVDSQTVYKSLELVIPLVRHTLNAKILTTEAANFILKHLLTCIHIHGQDEALCVRICTVILAFYELVIPWDTSIRNVFYSVTGVDDVKLSKFEKDIGLQAVIEHKPITRQMKPQTKREKLKALITEIIGKNVSEQFKEHVNIRNLPPLVKTRTKLSDIVADSADGEAAGLCSLFSPHNF